MFWNPHTFSVSVGTTEVALCTLLPSTVVDVELIVSADITNAWTIYIWNTWLTAGTVRATDGSPLLAWKSKVYFVSNPRDLYVRSNTGTNLIYVEANY